MATPVHLVLVGIGGYGEAYVSTLLDEAQGARCTIVGAVDPAPERCSRLADLEARGIPVFASLDEFFLHGTANLAVISSPIQYHTEQVLQALTNDCHVLVEKPVAAVLADVDKMIEARDRAGKFVAVGYQWSFSGSILSLKKDILAGNFGAAVGGRSLTLWPRTESYYSRNGWAGRERDADGRWILDSPANNAMAHFLHNLLFLFGDELDRAAEPTELDAHLVRVNTIETFDTVAAKIRVANGAELLFLASHAICEQETIEPRFQLVFEEATVDFPGDLVPMTARFRDGRRIEYQSPRATHHMRKLWACVNAIVGDGQLPCGLETARPHVQCIEMLRETQPPIRSFSAESTRWTETSGGRLRWVDGLAKALKDAYETNVLPEFTGSL